MSCAGYGRRLVRATTGVGGGSVRTPAGKPPTRRGGTPARNGRAGWVVTPRDALCTATPLLCWPHPRPQHQRRGRDDAAIHTENTGPSRFSRPETLVACVSSTEHRGQAAFVEQRHTPEEEEMDTRSASCTQKMRRTAAHRRTLRARRLRRVRCHLDDCGHAAGPHTGNGEHADIGPVSRYPRRAGGGHTEGRHPERPGHVRPGSRGGARPGEWDGIRHAAAGRSDRTGCSRPGGRREARPVHQLTNRRRGLGQGWVQFRVDAALHSRPGNGERRFCGKRNSDVGAIQWWLLHSTASRNAALVKNAPQRSVYAPRTSANGFN